MLGKAVTARQGLISQANLALKNFGRLAKVGRRRARSMSTFFFSNHPPGCGG
jgi:hypothetical protein